MDDQFNNWVSLWDKAQAAMSKDDKKTDTRKESFFGMKSVQEDDLDFVSPQDVENWKDVDNRTDQLYGKVDSHQLFIEAKKEDKKKKKGKKKSAAESTHKEADPDDSEGIGAILAKSLGDADQFVSPNPIHFASVGIDQKPRITPNWTSGTALIALAKLRAAMYDLECEMLTAEAMGGKNVTTLEGRLESLQKQFDKLSQSIVPNPKNDVS
jgi:hypothetical protein